MLKSSKWLGKVLALALSVAVVGTSAIPMLTAQAAVDSDSNVDQTKKGKITITLEDLGKDSSRTGVKLACYKVWEITLDEDGTITKRTLTEYFKDAEQELSTELQLPVLHQEYRELRRLM